MLDYATLDARLRALRPARDRAPIQLLVTRQRGERRSTPEVVTLDPARGVLGDQWSQDRPPKIDAQVTLMRWDVASLMHQTPAIFGDNLFATLDTSASNLPPGTVVRVGQARCVVTPKPHRGCSKFQARAGRDALKIMSSATWKAASLRGVHLRVLEGGEVRLGDEIVVERRAAPPGWREKLPRPIARLLRWL